MRVITFLLPALLACTALTAVSIQAPASAQGSFGVSITLAPPELPIYDQPPMPGNGYIWTPGYWQYSSAGYYWVPGTWVEPPMAGLLWTPGYWGWSGGYYLWNAPYWGVSVGYYGGINYGFGYGGDGYAGGRWNNGHFDYNRDANNFGSKPFTNSYSAPIGNHGAGNHASFNGGTGGVRAQPTAAQLAVGHEAHTAPTQAQTQHVKAAAANPALQHNTNGGRPAIAATSRPAEFTGQGVVGTRGAGAPQPTAPAGQPQHAAGAPGPVIAPQPASAAPTASPLRAPAAAAPAQAAPAPQLHQAPPAQAAPAPQVHQAPPAQAAPAPQVHQAPPAHQQAAPPPAHAAPPPQAQQEKKLGG